MHIIHNVMPALPKRGKRNNTFIVIQVLGILSISILKYCIKKICENIIKVTLFNLSTIYITPTSISKHFFFI